MEIPFLLLYFREIIADKKENMDMKFYNMSSIANYEKRNKLIKVRDI